MNNKSEKSKVILDENGNILHAIKSIDKDLMERIGLSDVKERYEYDKAIAHNKNIMQSKTYDYCHMIEFATEAYDRTDTSIKSALPEAYLEISPSIISYQIMRKSLFDNYPNKNRKVCSLRDNLMNSEYLIRGIYETYVYAEEMLGKSNVDISLFLGENNETSIWTTSRNVFKEMRYLINETSDNDFLSTDEESVKPS